MSSDEGALVCSKQPCPQSDLVFEMCYVVHVHGRAIGWPHSSRTREARLLLGRKATETEHWQGNTYKLLGEHRRFIHFAVFVLGLLKRLHCNSWVYACIESTVPSQCQQAALACGTLGCCMEEGCAQASYVRAWENFVFHLHWLY